MGDNPNNPDPDCSVANQDDELYNLALGNSANASPFIAAGDTFLRLLTRNPSNDDNVFGLFITSTFEIKDPTEVPEPATLALAGLGLVDWRQCAAVARNSQNIPDLQSGASGAAFFRSSTSNGSRYWLSTVAKLETPPLAELS